MFDHILLLPEQDELIVSLVEVARSVDRSQRDKFVLIEVVSTSFVLHSGSHRRIENIYRGDIEQLGHSGLLALSVNHNNNLIFDVTPLGFRYYTHLKEKMGSAAEQIEKTVTLYLNATEFQERYTVAYSKWSEANKLLWDGESEKSLTTIGHLCREAVQEFAEAALVRLGVDSHAGNKAQTISRMRQILDARGEKLGAKYAASLDAMLAYWGTTVDLIQRQEHGGIKEGDPLLWEDGRRVVFHTAVVLFELGYLVR